MTDPTEGLRAWARGVYALEAGVELLIRSHSPAVREGSPWLTATSEGVWLNVEELLDHAGVYSGGEQRIIRLAASLIAGEPVNLSEELPGLDRENTALFLAAVAHANGSHEHSGWDTDEQDRPHNFHQLNTLYPWPA